MRRLVQGTSNAIKSGQANQLAIVPQGSDINFYINGSSVATLRDEAAMSGAAGFLAISSGMFAFDNFTLYQPSHSTAALSNSDRAEQTPNVFVSPQLPPQAPRDEEQTAPTTTASDASSQTASTSHPEMLQSYEKVLKVGMPKQQVVQLFGDPSYERGPRFFYELNTDGSGQGSQTLVIQFDGDDYAKI